MINKAILVGNVGNAPEIRTTQSGQKVASFNLATTERFKDKSGQMQELTEWHRVSAWGNLADIIEKYVIKGSQIYAEGKIKTTSYDKDGQKHYQTNIVADTIKLLGRKDNTQQGQQGQQGQQSQQTQTQAQRPQSQQQEPEIDDLPF